MSKYFDAEKFERDGDFEDGSFNYECWSHYLIHHFSEHKRSEELMKRAFRSLEWIMHDDHRKHKGVAIGT